MATTSAAVNATIDSAMVCSSRAQMVTKPAKPMMINALRMLIIQRRRVSTGTRGLAAMVRTMLP
ncbi:hypothetical protein D3C78_1871620 [compost metagenome]